DRETGQAFAQLQRLSPLTRLLRADRLYESFDFRGMLVVLDDVELCRYAVNSIVDRGVGRFMPGFAVGFRVLAEDSVASHEVGRVARFLATVVGTHTFFRPDTSDA